MGEVEDMGLLAKLPLENGHSSCLVVLPKFKRRKVSVVRDFPPGCGRNAPPINMRPMESAVASVGTDKNFVAKEKVCAVSEVGAVKMSGNEVDSRINMGTVSIVPSVGTDENLVGKERISNALEAAAAGMLGTEFGSQSNEDSKSLLPMCTSVLPNNLESEEGKAVVLSDMMEGGELMNVECLGIEFPMALDNAGLTEPLKELEYNAPELSKDAQQVELFDSVKNVDRLEMKNVLEGDAMAEDMLPDSAKSWSPPNQPAAAAANDEKNMTKKYPPRRRISAKRDFPPLCGRNAPHLVKEECMKAIASSKNKILGWENSVLEQKSLAEMARTDVKESGENVQDGDAAKSNLEGIVSKEIEDNVPAESERDAARKLRMQAHLETSSQIRAEQEDTNEKGVKPPQESILCQPGSESQAVNKKSNTDVKSFEEKGWKKHVIHTKEKSPKRKFSGVAGSQNQFQLEDPSSLELAFDKVIVQALMAAPYCPWRQGKGTIKPNLGGGISGSKRKKHNLTKEEKSTYISKINNNESEKSGGKSMKTKSPPTGKAAYQVTSQLVAGDAEGSSEDDEGHEDYRLVQRSHNLNVSLPPFGVSSLSGNGDNHDATITRNKVRETLRLFQAVCRKLLQEEEAKSKGERNTVRRIDLLAAKILKDKGKYVNTGKQITGPVPGVEVGDEFHYRVELAIVGIHRPLQGGIDYLKQGGRILATSIVASGGYADDLDNSDVLIYSGSGGNVMSGDKQPEDQKLERGNLALKNSISEQNPVRVIRGFKESKASDSLDAKVKIVMTYTYDGLYLVQKYWQEMGQHGKLVFKFQLNRIPGQPELAWKEVKKSKKFKVREGLCVDDISQGKEIMPICAVNTLDDGKPPPFTYITSMIYPTWYHPTPLSGCNCVAGCSDSERCSCAVKNGGEIPYNHNGAIVEAKPLVYECGPSCRCPPSCHNRVSQHGIKFQLEIFKTESRGWGVRSLNSIPSGSFICEYIGELLEDKEAEQKTGNDEYLFDIGHNYNDHTLWDGLSTLMPDSQSSSCEVVEDGGFTIDAARFGSVGRFINHSCSPNLYAQNVLYDHGDKRMPHIMLFAAENIPPLQELTYHYNYTIDQVHDSDGNIKKKSCYCGSPECTGRMY